MRGALPFLLLATCAHAEPRVAGTTHYVFGGSGRDGNYDCSGYVNEVLRADAPDSYAEARRLRHRPRAREYAELGLSPMPGWTTVKRVADLRPGDIVAWTHRTSEAGDVDTPSTGHVVIVRARPRPDPDRPDAWQVRVADAAKSGHSDDTRPPGADGVGEGTILLETDASGAPIRFAWRVEGRWQNPATIGMGRPAYRREATMPYISGVRATPSGQIQRRGDDGSGTSRR